MTDTEYPTSEASADAVEGIIRDYVATGCKTADTGAPTGLDSKTWSAAIKEVRHLHLAEPHLPAAQIIKALLLLGWSAPEPQDSSSEGVGS